MRIRWSDAVSLALTAPSFLIAQPAGLVCGAMALLLTGCGPKPLPPAPPLKPGEGFFANAAGFPSSKILSFCSAANTASASGQLASMTDTQIANGTCETSIIAVEAISREIDPDQVCVASMAAMIREFDRRFPGHDPKEVAGRC